MSNIDALIHDLVSANRILAHEGIVDGFGHVSLRHPDDPGRFFLARARAPQNVVPEDILEFTLDGQCTKAGAPMSYIERYIHCAVFEARPDVKSVIHNHSKSLIPFGVTGNKLRPIMHDCATIGCEVPVWDCRTNFGDTDLLVRNMAMGRDLVKTLGNGTTALMRGHGCVIAERSLKRAVHTAIYMEHNAELQRHAMQMGGDITFLSPGEVAARFKLMDELDNKPLAALDRAWEYWCQRAGVEYRPPV